MTTLLKPQLVTLQKGIYYSATFVPTGIIPPLNQEYTGNDFRRYLDVSKGTAYPYANVRFAKSVALPVRRFAVTPLESLVGDGNTHFVGKTLGAIKGLTPKSSDAYNISSAFAMFVDQAFLIAQEQGIPLFELDMLCDELSTPDSQPKTLVYATANFYFLETETHHSPAIIAVRLSEGKRGKTSRVKLPELTLGAAEEHNSPRVDRKYIPNQTGTGGAIRDSEK